MNTGTAVSSPAFLVNGLYVSDKIQVLLFSSASWISLPAIVPAWAHSKHPTHRYDSMLPSMIFNETVSYRGRLLKIPTAFFKISTSSWRRAFSFLSRANSSSFGLPLPGNGLFVFSLILCCHFFSKLIWIPKSRATRDRLPLCSTNATASRLNSSV